MSIALWDCSHAAREQLICYPTYLEVKLGRHVLYRFDRNTPVPWTEEMGMFTRASLLAPGESSLSLMLLLLNPGTEEGTIAEEIFCKSLCM